MSAPDRNTILHWAAEQLGWVHVDGILSYGDGRTRNGWWEPEDGTDTTFTEDDLTGWHGVGRAEQVFAEQCSGYLYIRRNPAGTFSVWLSPLDGFGEDADPGLAAWAALYEALAQPMQR